MSKFIRSLSRKSKDAGPTQKAQKGNPDENLVRGGSLNEEDPIVQKMGVIGTHKYRNKDLRLFVGDKIRLANKRKGKVTSLGPKQDRPGVYVRVVIDTAMPNSSNSIHSNGSANKTTKAIWVPMHSVEKVIEKANRYDFTIGDRVFIEKKNIAGYVRYVGPTHFERGIWFGIELDDAKGKNNGTVKKKFYFSSKDDHGLFVHHKRLSLDPNDPRLRDPQQSTEELLRRGGYLNQDGTMNYENVNIANKQVGAAYNITLDEEDHKNGTMTNGNMQNGHYSHYSNDSMRDNSPDDDSNNNSNNNNNNNTNNSNSDITGHGASNSGSFSTSGMSANMYEDEDGGYNMDNDNEYVQPSPQTNSSNDSPFQNDIGGGSHFNTLSDAARTLTRNSNDMSPYNNAASNPKFQFRQKEPFDGFKYLTDANPKQQLLRDPEIEINERILTNFIKQKNTLTGLHKELYECEYPTLIEAKKEDREAIFKQKLIFCRAICDFSNESEQSRVMIAKKEKMLMELSEFIARHHWFKEPLYHECLITVSENLFRPLPYQYRPPSLSFFNDEVFDKDVNFEDPGWRHLKLVYDLTWRVINTPSVTADMMEKYMTSKPASKTAKEGRFLESLVELFASEDHRERAYLMMILHKIYGRCLKLRPLIIKIICNYLYRMIYTNEFNHVNGIIELLQIICAIIPGLTVPVKDSWQEFLRTILVPLHKCRGLKKFWEQLTQCCVNYVAKDTQGGTVILGGLLKYWPKQSPQKEEIFIMEVVNIINVLITHQLSFQYDLYKDILVAAADKLTQCMLSTRQPVAERAIAAWKEQSMQRLVDYDRKAFLPKLCEAFYKNRNHQNQALRTSSTTVEKIYRSKDSAYWKKMQQYLQKKEKKEKQIEKNLEEAQEQGKDMIEYVNNYHKKHNKANDPKKKKRKKHLTPKEIEAKRKAHWEKINEIAKQNQQNHQQRGHMPGDSKSSNFSSSAATPSPTDDEY